MYLKEYDLTGAFRLGSPEVTVEGHDLQSLMRLTGAKEVQVVRTMSGYKIIDESKRVLVEVDARNDKYWLIRESPIMEDYADRGWSDD